MSVTIIPQNTDTDGRLQMRRVDRSVGRFVKYLLTLHTDQDYNAGYIKWLEDYYLPKHPEALDDYAEALLYGC